MTASGALSAPTGICWVPLASLPARCALWLGPLILAHPPGPAACRRGEGCPGLPTVGLSEGQPSLRVSSPPGDLLWLLRTVPHPVSLASSPEKDIMTLSHGPRVCHLSRGPTPLSVSYPLPSPALGRAGQGSGLCCRLHQRRARTHGHSDFSASSVLGLRSDACTHLGVLGRTHVPLPGEVPGPPCRARPLPRHLRLSSMKWRGTSFQPGSCAMRPVSASLVS